MQFNKILPISAKTNSDDIKLIKSAIRETLDLEAEEADEVDEIEVVQNLKRGLIERGPSLT